MVASAEVPPFAPDFDERKRDIFPLQIRSKIHIENSGKKSYCSAVIHGRHPLLAMRGSEYYECVHDLGELETCLGIDDVPRSKQKPRRWRLFGPWTPKRLKHVPAASPGPVIFSGSDATDSVEFEAHSEKYHASERRLASQDASLPAGSLKHACSTAHREPIERVSCPAPSPLKARVLPNLI